MRFVSFETAEQCLDLNACSIINIKPGRVGGYLEAKRIHDLCNERGVPVWCGGMLETGIGRAANLALAALPGFTLPGDTSASSRYFHKDITEPFVMKDGKMVIGADGKPIVNDYMIRETFKGIDPKRLKEAIMSSMDDNDIRQMQIDAYVKYRGYTPGMMYDEAKDRFNTKLVVCILDTVDDSVIAATAFNTAF